MKPFALLMQWYSSPGSVAPDATGNDGLDVLPDANVVSNNDGNNGDQVSGIK